MCMSLFFYCTCKHDKRIDSALRRPWIKYASGGHTVLSGICEFEILLRGVSCRQLYKMFLFFWAYNHSMS